MRAAVCTRYGPPEVMEVRDLPRPTPKAKQILVKVHRACVNSGDARIRGLNVPSGMGLFMRLAFGFRGPRQPVLGNDLAGVVEAVGSEVSRFRAGDEVFGSLGLRQGAHAEYVTVAEGASITSKPQGLSFEESVSLVFGGLTAESFLRRDAELQAGEKLLVNGASGAVGCAAVQLGKALGATVTAVCSQQSAELVASLGADRVIDYREVDFAREGRTYDVIMDNVGNASWKRSKQVLSPTGRLLSVVSTLPEMIRAPWVSRKAGRKVFAGVAGDSVEALKFLSQLVTDGKLLPVIDGTYPLDDIVEAHARVDSGRKRGSVVLRIAD
ncbi:MAG: NAD(P)-dependent alcohol dehydrogenase [Acidobacteriota bacterium]